MSKKLFEQFGGMISLRLKGLNPERIINMAISRGIYIWDIKKDGDKMHFKIRNSAFSSIKKIADEQEFEIEVLDKVGLPFYKGVLKRRFAFLVGAPIFILAIYFLSSFIWFLEISGNEKIASEKILLIASDYGLSKGAAKWNFSKSKVEKEILKEINELSYVQLDIKGVKARINVVEKIIPKEEISGPVNIVAKRSGIVEDVLVLEGEASVGLGDSVKKGDILISGVIFPPEQVSAAENEQVNEEIRLVRARGVVKAKVWFEGYGECYIYSDKKKFTGKEKSFYSIKTPWKEFFVPETKFPFSLFEEEIFEKEISTPLGAFIFKRFKLKEFILEKIQYSEEEATKIAEEKAVKSLGENIVADNDNELAIEKELISLPSEAIIRVKVIVEKIEDIGEVQLIKR